MTASDTDLVLAARGGDGGALASLLERHRAGMTATALAVLGWTPETEDVVQDAMLVGLTRLDQLRDPAAAGPWLRALVRNGARMQARSARRETVTGEVFEHLPSRDPTPEEALDGLATQNWVRAAISRLSEPLQTVVLLRYFTAVSAYDQIAALCGVPVGTVRSRLSEARRKLADGLLAAADAEHADVSAMTARRRQEAEFLLDSAPRGSFATAFAEVSSPDVVLASAPGLVARGRGLLVRIMEWDLEAGVRQRLGNVVAGDGVTVWECALDSPPWDPEHCPPGVVWLITVADDRISRIRLFHPAPPM